MKNINKLFITTALTALTLTASAVDITDTDLILSEDSTTEHTFKESGTSDAYRTFTINEGVTLEVSDGEDDAISAYGDDLDNEEDDDDRPLQYLAVINNGSILNHQSLTSNLKAVNLFGIVSGEGTISYSSVENNGIMNVSNGNGRVYAIDINDNTSVVNNSSIIVSNTDAPEDNGEDYSNAYGIWGDDNNSIVNNGSIFVEGAYDSFGINMGDSTDMTNTGTITSYAYGDDAYGLEFAEGSDATIINSGTIIAKSFATGTSNSAYGIETDDDANITIINTGTILSYSSGVGEEGEESRSYGVYLQDGAASDDRLNVYNYGTISGSANNSDGYGMIVDDHANLYNYGTFTGTVRNGSGEWGKAKGISMGEDESSITMHNYGTIEGYYTGETSSAAGGVWAMDTEYGGEVKNFGTMTATMIRGAGNAYGIASQIENPDETEHSMTVDNYGTICAIAKSGDAYGFLAFGGDKRINLHPGSTIKGLSASGESYAVSFTDGDNNTDSDGNIVYLSTAAKVYGKVRFTEGEDNWLIIDDLGNDDSNIHYEFEGNYNLAILNPQGLYIEGSLVYVSQTNFAMMNEVTTQITSGIDDSVNGRLLGLMRDPNEKESFWTKAFGKYQERPKIGITTKSESQSAGIVVGYDKKINEKIRAGGFVGGIGGKLKAGKTATNVKDKSTGFTVGAYADYKFKNGITANFVTNLGYLDHDHDRYDLHNGNGNAVLNSSYDEYFVNPSVSLYKAINFKGLNIVPSLSVGYLGQSFSGFSENGSHESAIKVASRYASTVKEKAQLSLIYNKDISGKKAKVNLDLGVESRQHIGKRRAKVTLLKNGNTNDYALKGGKNFHDAFVGFGMNVAKSKNTLLFADAKINKGLNHSWKDNFGISASTGLKINF